MAESMRYKTLRGCNNPNNSPSSQRSAESWDQIWPVSFGSQTSSEIWQITAWTCQFHSVFMSVSNLGVVSPNPSWRAQVVSVLETSSPYDCGLVHSSAAKSPESMGQKSPRHWNKTNPLKRYIYHWWRLCPEQLTKRWEKNDRGDNGWW